jgi:hypothetical protein
MSNGSWPSRRQVERTRAVVRWYFERYRGTRDDLGSAAMFCDSSRVGQFAVTRSELAAGTPAALFRVFVAAALFQRLQDVLVFKILTGIRGRDVDELTSSRRLVRLARLSPCPFLKTHSDVEVHCDLSKHPVTREGDCAQHSEIDCHLKRHTVLLKRYGDFGKVPTSAALLLDEEGVRDLRALRMKVLRSVGAPCERAAALLATLRRVWRVDRKIAAMFLAAVSNPDLSPGLSPWSEGVDWTRFVVIDSNADNFLSVIGYGGARTYAAREEFVRALAEKIDLTQEDRAVHAFNPRIVQQAMYLFMSETNRRASGGDCAQRGACLSCPKPVRTLCPVVQRVRAPRRHAPSKKAPRASSGDYRP